MVESLPADAEGTGSSPGLGRSRVPRSNWAREPQLLSLRVWSLCSATRAAATVRGPRIAMKSGPRLPRLGGALAQKRGPNTAKKKKKKKTEKETNKGRIFLKILRFVCLGTGLLARLSHRLTHVQFRVTYSLISLGLPPVLS